MSKINETALNAVYRQGYQRGRSECWDELKGGKRWWLMYPMTFIVGIMLGSCFGMALMLLLDKWVGKP